MPYHGKPTTLTALVLDSIYHFWFHAGWDMQQGWGKQPCFVLDLCHFLSYYVRRGAFQLARATVDIYSSHPGGGRKYDMKLPFSVCLECFFQIQDSLSPMCLIHQQRTMRTIPKVQKEWSSEIHQLAVQVSKLKKSPEWNPSRIISKAN